MAVDIAAKFREWRDHPAVMVRELFGVEPDPWQFDVLEAFPNKQRISLQASKGPGKGHPKSMRLFTPDGEVEWRDVRVGSWLFAEDGMPTQVTAVHELGVRAIYRVTFDDGSSVRCTGDHLWKVKGERERRLGLDWSVIDVAEILRRGVRVKNGKWAGRQFMIPTQGAVAMLPGDLPLDPYLVGVWLGDGTRSQPEYMKPYVEVEREINRRGYVTRRGAGDMVRVMNAVDQFRKIECYGCKSPYRFIPDAYKNASIPQRRDLLCGLMDADGSIDTDSSMEFSTTSEQMANDVVWLVRSLGGAAFIKAAIKKGWYRSAGGERVDCRNCYRVTIRTPFNPFLIPHKAERWRSPYRSPSTQRYLTRYIDSIELDGFEEAHCVEVDHPSHCYLANDFVVTHNTCVLAWLAWNFMLTRPRPKLAATSISGQNLADNFWTEMAKWQNKAPLLKHMFEWTKTRIFAKEDPAEWWMSARTWPASGDATQQADTLAGLHADYIMFVLDESGGMPDAVMASAEAALSSCIEGHIVQAGNPTALSGPLYQAHKARHLWHVIEVNGDPDNPRRSPRVSLEWANEQIKEYGRDNPWVLVNVFGQFPPSSMNALIGVDEVEAAMSRYYRDYEIGNVPKIMGVDVARFGDDSSAIAKRQGIQMFPFATYRNLDSTQGASIVTRAWNEFNADAVFLDATGGFGSGWEDQLRLLGRAPIGVQFAGAAHNKLKFYNKRAEMAFDFVDWIKKGGALPQSNSLKSALTQTLYTFQGDRLLLEPKEVVKTKLGGMSPDEFDAAILTFAEPVSIQAARARNGRHTFSWEPFGGDVDTAPRYEYDPFA